MIDVVEYVTKATWKWAGYVARMKDNRWAWAIRQSEWKIKSMGSVRRSKGRWRDDTVEKGKVWTRKATSCG